MDATLANKFQHRQLMLKVSRSLGNEDLTDLKYLCEDIIAETALVAVRCATDLFTLLQYHGYLGPGCYGFIRRSLASIRRDDLASTLPEDSKDSLVPRSSPPSSHCTLKHRMMLVAIADRLRKEDIIKLLFVTSGKVHDSGAKVTDDAISALRLLTGLEESKYLCCNSHSDLCDLLRLIGRSDLADLAAGFHRNLPRGFTMSNQALGLLMEVLRSKRKVYVYHQERLAKMKDGDHKVIHDIHSTLLGICEKSLSSRKPVVSVTSAIKRLESAFDSQFQLMQCVVSDGQQLQHKESFNFINAVFATADDHTITDSNACPVANSAHQTRKFILEVSCEIIGKERATKVRKLNDKIEGGINICSGYGRHISSFLSDLADLLSSVSRKMVTIDSCRTELMNIFSSHKNYVMGIFPVLAPHLQPVQCLKDLPNISLMELSHLTTSPSNLNSVLTGPISMVTIPSYAILLNMLCTSSRLVDCEALLENLIEYVHLSSHIAGSFQYVQRCAAALHDHLASFQQEIVELDDLCAPLITELINPSTGLL